jgi:hypothetical protein
MFLELYLVQLSQRVQDRVKTGTPATLSAAKQTPGSVTVLVSSAAKHARGCKWNIKHPGGWIVMFIGGYTAAIERRHFQLHGMGVTLGCRRIVIDLTQVNAIRGSIVTGKN